MAILLKTPRKQVFFASRVAVLSMVFTGVHNILSQMAKKWHAVPCAGTSDPNLFHGEHTITIPEWSRH